MMKMRFKMLRSFILDTPLSIGFAALGFVAILMVRLNTESMLFSYPVRDASWMFFEATHLGFLALITLFLFVPLLRFALRTDFVTAARIMLFGFIMMPLPPLADKLIMGNRPYISFYEFDGLRGLGERFLTFFGDTPEMGLTYGPRILTALVIIGMTIATFVVTRQWFRALAAGFLSYVILFVMGTLPSWLTLIVASFKKPLLSISDLDIVALFLSPGNLFERPPMDVMLVFNTKMSIILILILMTLAAYWFWKEYRLICIALWKNARLPQIVWHGGLVLLGMLLGVIFSDVSANFSLFDYLATIVLLAAVVSAWLASVVTNDIYDTLIDQKTNPKRPLIEKTVRPETYKEIGILFFALSLILSGIVSFPAMFLLVCYQGLAWIYSAPPFRLKRVPVLATILASIAGLSIFFAGFVTVSPTQDLAGLPASIALFLLAAYAVSIPIKDFKDIEGDRGDHVLTLPVILGAERAKLLLGSLVFLCYFTSPFVLHAPSIGFPALIFGSLTFWALQRGTADEHSPFSYRKLPGIVLAIAATYGILIAMMLSA